jgi:hypothetical protein
VIDLVVGGTIADGLLQAWDPAGREVWLSAAQVAAQVPAGMDVRLIPTRVADPQPPEWSAGPARRPPATPPELAAFAGTLRQALGAGRTVVYTPDAVTVASNGGLVVRGAGGGILSGTAPRWQQAEVGWSTDVAYAVSNQPPGHVGVHGLPTQTRIVTADPARRRAETPQGTEGQSSGPPGSLASLPTRFGGQLALGAGSSSSIAAELMGQLERSRAWRDTRPADLDELMDRASALIYGVRLALPAGREEQILTLIAWHLRESGGDGGHVAHQMARVAAEELPALGQPDDVARSAGGSAAEGGQSGR